MTPTRWPRRPNLRALARQREQACVTALLALYNFRPSDIDADALPLQGERWAWTCSILRRSRT